MGVPYQCGVDGLNLVLLKRSEARNLAAQVGVHQHLRSGGEQSIRQEKSSAEPPAGEKLLVYLGTIDCFPEQTVISLSL